MSGRHFYLGGQKNERYNTNDDDDETEEVEKDEDSEFLQEVPYSSSSVDRSSIGSIPWADDAIKKNKMDWDRVERMLCGEEPLSEEEPDLRHEIEDWQRKFPYLIGRKAKILKQQSFDSSHTAKLDNSGDDIESISNLSLNSLDGEEDDVEDDLLTPTVERQGQFYTDLTESQPSSFTKYFRPANNDLVTLLDRDLRITSVKLRQREDLRRFSPNQPITTTKQFLAAPISAISTQAANSARAPRSRLRMPPILNVLDSNRRFRGLLNNRSFVQLTQIQQQTRQPIHAKSAALDHGSAERRPACYDQGNRSAWHVPLAASRFLNNRNCRLPAINRQHRGQSTTTSSDHQYSNSSSLSSDHGLQHYNRPAAISNSSTTPSTGRSISAAVHHPRSDYLASAFYIPYSASKFKAFK